MAKGRAGAGADTAALDPLDWKVITSAVDKSKGTMSVLYGNEVAVDAARKGTSMHLAHAKLALVTWAQKEDEHWYGANIPASIQSIETLSLGIDPEGTRYTFYEGHPLKAARDTGIDVSARIAYLTGFKASVMP